MESFKLGGPCQRFKKTTKEKGSVNPLREEIRRLESKSCSVVSLCDPMDYTLQVIYQARILKWVAVPFSRVSSQPWDWAQIDPIAGRFFTSWTTREDQEYWSGWPVPSPADLPGPGIKPWSPTLQADSLPTELPGKPKGACYPSFHCSPYPQWQISEMGTRSGEEGYASTQFFPM